MSGLILIIDDEQDLVDSLSYNLETQGFVTRTALTGARGLDAAFSPPIPDLILLDLMLPDMSGFDVCKSLRANPSTAHTLVLMLTARGDEVDRVVGFEVGADDYVVKPFSMRELGLRVKALLRRGHSDLPESDVISFGRVRVDLSAHQAWVDDSPIALTALEFKLLTTLMKRRGRAQTRATLLEDVWEMRGDVSTRTVDTHVKRLREKLGPAGVYLETLRGVGYRFRSRPDDVSSS